MITPTQIKQPQANNNIPLVDPNKKRNRNITPFKPNPMNSNETVSGNLDSILSQGSPLMDRARSNAAKVSANRGLLNSSAAVAAGEQAVISQALPIAQGDAQAYQKQSDRVYDAQKQQSQFTQQNSILDQQQTFQGDQNEKGRLLQRDQMTQQQGQFDANLGLQQDQLTFKKQDAKANRDLTIEQAALNRQQQSDMIDKQSEYQSKRDAILQKYNLDAIGQQGAINLQNTMKELEQRQANNLASISAQATENQKLNYASSQTNIVLSSMDQIGQIYSNPNMTPEQQQNAVDAVKALAAEQGKNIGAIFDPNPDYGAPDNTGNTASGENAGVNPNIGTVPPTPWTGRANEIP